ncbi:hypothetical protein KIPB_008320, partial [Kipferlia bialata]|eukprot:g8320.t1
MSDGDSVISYEAPWPLYSVAWSERSDCPFRLAVGSHRANWRNYVQLLQLSAPSDDDKPQHLEPRSSFRLFYPATKVQFLPSAQPMKRDLFAVSGDYLRIVEVLDEKKGAAAAGGAGATVGVENKPTE